MSVSSVGIHVVYGFRKVTAVRMIRSLPRQVALLFGPRV